jgi:hypothetical protein
MVRQVVSAAASAESRFLRQAAILEWNIGKSQRFSTDDQ